MPGQYRGGGQSITAGAGWDCADASAIFLDAIARTKSIGSFGAARSNRQLESGTNYGDLIGAAREIGARIVAAMAGEKISSDRLFSFICP